MLHCHRNRRIARRRALAYRHDMMQHQQVETMTGLDLRWKALASRDAAADGTFVYAVTSTGIYCRPSCPSRRPRADRVRFFDTTLEARQAGFRACKRCRPDTVGLAQPGIDAVRTRVGVSRHPRRSDRDARIISRASRR